MSILASCMTNLSVFRIVFSSSALIRLNKDAIEEQWCQDRRTSDELRKLFGGEPITTVIKSGRLRWYRHVLRKSDKDWVTKCMEYRVEGRRSVGRLKWTWL